ncbi:MAG TPA: hypothetical protein VF808_10080 [Ktedonobacterales bacterium]
MSSNTQALSTRNGHSLDEPGGRKERTDDRMTGDRKDGSRKGMRAIPLTQRQRKRAKPAEPAPQPAETTSPHASGTRRRAQPESATSAPTRKPAAKAPAVTPAPSHATRTALRPAAPKAPAQNPARKPAPAQPTPAASNAAPTAQAPAPRRTLRRPPPSVTPVSPLDLVDTAPLIAPASLRPQPEPELPETTRLKLPRGAQKSRAPFTSQDDPSLTVTAPLAAPASAPIDMVDTTQLVPPVDMVNTTHLPPAVEAMDTGQLASFQFEPAAPAELPATSRLKAPRSGPRRPQSGQSSDQVETSPLALRLTMASIQPAVDAVDTTQLMPPLDTVDTTQLGAPADPAMDTLNTTQLSAPESAPPSAPVDQIDTTRLSAPPTVETSPVVTTPPTARGSFVSAPSDPGSPRRVKVRVRRKRAEAPGAPAAAPELADTEILASPPPAAPKTDQSTLTLNIIMSADTARIAPDGAPSDVTVAGADLPATTKLSSLEASRARLSPASQDEDTAASAKPIARPDAVDARPSMELAETLAEDPAAEATESLDAADVTEHDVEPEPDLAVTARKLPTLAVMAALANRADARADDVADEVPESLSDLSDEDTGQLPAVQSPIQGAAEIYTPPSQPLTSMEAEQGETAGVDTQPAQAAALLSDLRAMMDENPSVDERRPNPGRLGQLLRRPASQPFPAPDGDARSGPLAGGQRRIWSEVAPHQGNYAVDPHGVSGQSARVATPVIPSPATRRALNATTPLWSPRARWPQRGRVSGWQTRAQDEESDALLVWAGGAQAVLAGAGAFVAAIALLSGGPRALGVFAWAISFSLIAGVSAAAGHLAWRNQKTRIATLAITLSHLLMLVWALALLGPLPAFMALVPVTIALTLRGLGRIEAIFAAVAESALYLVALGLGASGRWPFPQLVITGLAATALNGALIVAGVGLGLLALMRLFSAGERERARVRAIERASYLTTSELDALRAQTEDDADALRRALAAALQGRPSGPVWTRGALSPLADQVNITGDRLAELTHDREERKRLEAAVRRLIANMRRARLGLTWELPEASGVILDDLIALMRTPSPGDQAWLPEESTPTGQIVAPHLYRASQPGVSIPSQPLQAQQRLWPDQAPPSQPSGVWATLWPSDPGSAAPGGDPLALPPSPRFPESSSRYPKPGQPSAPLGPTYLSDPGWYGDPPTPENGNGSNGSNGRHQ